jgi:hypothetical protein
MDRPKQHRSPFALTTKPSRLLVSSLDTVPAQSFCAEISQIDLGFFSAVSLVGVAFFAHVVFLSRRLGADFMKENDDF